MGPSWAYPHSLYPTSSSCNSWAQSPILCQSKVMIVCRIIGYATNWTRFKTANLWNWVWLTRTIWQLRPWKSSKCRKFPKDSFAGLRSKFGLRLKEKSINCLRAGLTYSTSWKTSWVSIGSRMCSCQHSRDFCSDISMTRHLLRNTVRRMVHTGSRERSSKIHWMGRRDSLRLAKYWLGFRQVQTSIKDCSLAFSNQLCQMIT